MNIIEVLQWRYDLARMRHPKCKAPEFLPVLEIEVAAFRDYFNDSKSYENGFQGISRFNGVELRVVPEQSGEET